MNTIEYFKERFEELQSHNRESSLGTIRQKAFNAFNKMGIPTTRHEEWKYTRLNNLFNKEFQLSINQELRSVSNNEFEAFRLPGHEQANELIFVNGQFSFPLSRIRSKEQLVVIPLEEATKNEYREIVTKHFGHSSHYLKDGINALNTAFVQGAVFVYVRPGLVTEQPIYIYNVTDARASSILSQPRSLIYIGEHAKAQLVETFPCIGQEESFTNQVMEIVVEKGSLLEYYKIQNEPRHISEVSTTHIHQVGKSHTHTVTISLDGGLVRNNLNVILDAEHCESHLYGLYYQRGESHIDTHTVVDNVKPNCFSNELYKGILDDSSTGVFNGKIFVQPNAQKTNAYQSNKNILLSDLASVNTKPQLEIFADDVKCSHGCTIGRFDEEALFYLRSRGISEKNARALLLQAFVFEILENIKLPAIRTYVDSLISKRLELDLTW